MHYYSQRAYAKRFGICQHCAMRTADKASVHYRACNLCEAICGIEADQPLDIRGDKDDPFSRGYICPKAAALGDLHYDKDRLKYPVRRTPHGWHRLGWDEAVAVSGHTVTA